MSTVAVAVAALGGSCTRSQGSVTSTSPATSTTPPGALSPAVLDLDVRPAVRAVGDTIDGEIVTADGRTRTYHLYVPTSLPDDNVVLLVGLHGGLGNGMQFGESSGLVELAEANGFLAVFPDGTPIRSNPERAVWNGGGCCASAAEDQNDVDDVAFIETLIDTLSAKYRVDDDRVFVTGHSNGGILSMRLACELSSKVAAVAFQAGTLFIPHCRVETPVSALAIHGADDENVKLEGGAGDQSLVGVDFPPVRDGLASLAEANGCTGGDEPAASPAARQSDVTVESWRGCPEGVDVQLIVVAGANHAWMGHEQADISERRLGPAYQDLDASEVVWSFLSAHPRVEP